jgi:hypothetical protein
VTDIKIAIIRFNRCRNLNEKAQSQHADLQIVSRCDILIHKLQPSKIAARPAGRWPARTERDEERTKVEAETAQEGETVS